MNNPNVSELIEKYKMSKEEHDKVFPFLKKSIFKKSCRRKSECYVCSR